MTKAKFAAVHPVLQSNNVRRAIDYYVENLGFRLMGQDNPDEPRYAVIARDSVELHIQWHDDEHFADESVDRPMLRFVIPNIELLYEEYADKGVFHDGTALRETPWGTKEFAFFDPDLNGLTFYKDA
ncbi:MAG: VOC family protein [Chloroflexota bacterium]